MPIKGTLLCLKVVCLEIVVIVLSYVVKTIRGR